MICTTALLQVMQHLDDEGRCRITQQLRELPQSTVLVVGQRASFSSCHIDESDTVVKTESASRIELDS